MNARSGPAVHAQGSEELFERLQVQACDILARVRDESGRDVAIAGCLTQLVASYHPEVAPAYDAALTAYRRIVAAQAEHVDLFLGETLASTAEATAAARAVLESDLPVWISLKISDDDSVTLRSGEPLAEGVAALREILAEGTELLRIDPKDYELTLAQAKAELAELAVQAENAEASLAIEERSLELTRQDLERKQRLVQKGTASQSAVDEAERTLLATRAAVQQLQNTLALIPAQRQLLEAKAARAERDLEHTLIRAPFELRVANLSVEADQYVPAGQTLFEGDAIDRVEIEAQVAMSMLRRLFLDRPELAVQVSRLNEQLIEVVGLDPLVRLDPGNHVAEWQAEFVRFDDSIDPDTRTLGVVVAVDRPFDKVKPGYRPPLSKNMFVQVVLRGRRHAQRLIVPRSAVRSGVAYVADADDRLRRRPVEVLYSQGEVSVIRSGLEPGERVIVSDLVPAVDGMLLEVQIDEALAESPRALGAES